jgi:hypothetical protein
VIGGKERIEVVDYALRRRRTRLLGVARDVGQQHHVVLLDQRFLRIDVEPRAGNALFLQKLEAYRLRTWSCRQGQVSIFV